MIKGIGLRVYSTHLKILLNVVRVVMNKNVVKCLAGLFLFVFFFLIKLPILEIILGVIEFSVKTRLVWPILVLTKPVQISIIRVITAQTSLVNTENFIVPRIFIRNNLLPANKQKGPVDNFTTFFS